MREFISCDRRLQEILIDLMGLFNDTVVEEITSIYRTPEEEDAIEAKIGKKTSRIHTVGPPYRAIDVTIAKMGKRPPAAGLKTFGKPPAPTARESAQEAAEKAASKLNAIWCYNPGYPGMRVAVPDVHGTGPHIHLQVHENTVRR